MQSISVLFFAVSTFLPFIKEYLLSVHIENLFIHLKFKPEYR